MKRSNPALPRLLASLFVLSAAALTACASDDGTTDDDATGGAAGTGGAGSGGAGSGGMAGDGDAPSGGMAGDGDGVDPNELPSEISQAGVEAFLAAGTYMNPPWVGDAAARAPNKDGNAHGDSMRVFFNSAAAATKTRNDSTVAADPGSMTVKELYEGGAVVGHAVAIKTGDGMGWDSWTYYCNAPEGSNRCSGNVEAYPTFEEGPGSCGFCHAEVPIADLPQ